MSFKRFSFTKSWTDPVAFPTVESDENQVRADMQALHDESREGLNGLMGQLEEPSAAAHLGAEGGTVQSALDDLSTDRHTHENAGILSAVAVALTGELAAAYDRLVRLLNGVTAVTPVLGSDHTTVPTSKAVSDAMVLAGNLPAGGRADQALVKASDSNYDVRWADVKYAEDGHTHPIFSAGTAAPEETHLLWIDTTPNTGGLKYHDGTSWVHVPVAYS